MKIFQNIKLTKIPPFLLSSTTCQYFCKQAKQQKEEILKAYLEIIPPHRMQQLFENEKTNIIKYTNPQLLTSQQEIKKIFKNIKTHGHMMPIEDLTEVMYALNKLQDKTQSIQKMNTKIKNKIIGIFRKKIHFLSTQNLVNFIYKLVKMNYKEYELMKQVQRVLIEEKIKIDFPLIRKILWSYTHLNIGSTVLYSHISRSVKIGQHELSPLELSECAYMLSKVSENATGGFGVFQIAAKHVENHLSRLDFHQIVKASSFLLTQNLGSNDFQKKLEEALYDKFPDRATLRINDLVELLKSTATYYFKFKQNALLHMLKASTERFAPHASLEQFQDIIWSWGRSGKGDKQMWQIIENCLQSKFLSILKIRQVAFFYHSICSSQYSSSNLLKKLQQKFLSLLKQDTNQHYIIKMLLGMQKRKDYGSQLFLKLTLILSKRIPKLSNKQLISFAKTLNESDLHFENKEQKLKEIENSLETVQQIISNKIYIFGLHELTQLLYMWIKLDIRDSSGKFVNLLFDHLEGSIVDIPKPAFIKALFCFTIRDRYESSLKMIPILNQLTKYGPLAYFFSPFEAPLMAYCILHLSVNSEGSVNINPKLIEEVKNILKNTNPSILNEFVRKGYDEALKLADKI